MYNFFIDKFIHPGSNFWIGQVRVIGRWVTGWSNQNVCSGWGMIFCCVLKLLGEGGVWLHSNSNLESKGLLVDFNETTGLAQKELHYRIFHVYLAIINMEDKILVEWWLTSAVKSRHDMSQGAACPHQALTDLVILTPHREVKYTELPGLCIFAK